MRCPGILCLVCHCHSPRSLGFPITPSPMRVPNTAKAHGLSHLGGLCSCLDLFTGDIGFVSPQLLTQLGAELGHHQDGAGPHGVVGVPQGSADRSTDLSSTVKFQGWAVGSPARLWTVISQAEPRGAPSFTVSPFSTQFS